MKRKMNWQLLIGFVLVAYGIYSTYTAIGLSEISEMAANVTMGQASVFVIWGLREIFGGSMKYEIKK